MYIYRALCLNIKLEEMVLRLYTQKDISFKNVLQQH